MKKIFLIVIGALLLSGCGNSSTLTCTGSEEIEEGVTLNLKLTAKFNKDTLAKASVVFSFENEEIAKQYCSLFELANDDEIKFKCNGKNIEFDDYTATLDEDQKEEFKKITKEEFINNMKEDNVICK